jgi:hypothetical protein
MDAGKADIRTIENYITSEIHEGRSTWAGNIQASLLQRFCLVLFAYRFGSWSNGMGMNRCGVREGFSPES